MELKTLTTKLLQDIRENVLERFFDKFQQYIREDSELQEVIHLSFNRYQRLKTNIIKGIINDEDEMLEHNNIVTNLLEVIKLISENDLKEITIENTVSTHLNHIEKHKKDFQDTINQRSQRLIMLGQNLINFGGILREKPSPDDVIPYEEKIKIGTVKGTRRIKISFLELKELKDALVQGLQKMTKAYEQLVYYLDFPKEEIGTAQINSLKSSVNDLQNFIKKINPESDPVPQQIEQAKVMFEQVLPYQNQMGPTFEVFFSSATEIIQQCDSLLTFYQKNNQALLEIKNKLSTLSIELQLNIQEKEL